jgi:RNA polymerase sigma-70 factor (ECF subfamily)
MPWPEDTHLLDNAEFAKTLQARMNELPSNWFAAISLKYLEEKKEISFVRN